MVTEVLAGSLVLERMAEVGLVDAFTEAVDKDDIWLAASLMKRVGMDAETIESVLVEMEE